MVSCGNFFIVEAGMLYMLMPVITLMKKKAVS